ncbi:hypothetical protein MNB_SV-9-825 [hydrothermal vent metagenome]|uniref:Glycosyltransferase 2-like domain-containing protein n=1 Tax=hydrothermal vent metagenome TaxID=652676 RepID=A0A1W1BHR5_9ZZZZ
MKNLICINTYKSSELIKAFIWDYINFAKSRDDYHFIVSLDGDDKKSIDYCNKHKIPFIYSDINEGVGISKNRVLTSFNNYDNYFFIEDDIELLNPAVFDIHIKLSQELNIHHFSLFEARRIREEKNILEHKEFNVIQAMYGGAPFNFFTKRGIDIVGGFHTHFAKYKRFGHTEHSYRFVNNNIADYPFNIIKECLDGYFRWNDPISRIKLSVEISENRLFIEEEELILEKLKFYPIKTISPYHKNHIENMSNLNNIIYDKNVDKHKRYFYFKLNILEFARYVKSRLK